MLKDFGNKTQKIDNINNNNIFIMSLCKILNSRYLFNHTCYVKRFKGKHFKTYFFLHSSTYKIFTISHIAYIRIQKAVLIRKFHWHMFKMLYVMKYIDQGDNRKFYFKEIGFNDLFYIFKIHTKIILKCQLRFVTLLM